MNMRMKQIVNQFDFRFSAAKLATYGDIFFIEFAFLNLNKKALSGFVLLVVLSILLNFSKTICFENLSKPRANQIRFKRVISNL